MKATRCARSVRTTGPRARRRGASRSPGRASRSKAWRLPYLGQVTRTERRKADDTLIGETDNTLANLTTAASSVPGQAPAVFPYASQSVTATRELDGSLVATTTSATTYDLYGNPASLAETVAAGARNYTTATTNTYANDTVNWFPGRLIRAEVTNRHQQRPPATLPFCTRAARSPAISTGQRLA